MLALDVHFNHKRRISTFEPCDWKLICLGMGSRLRVCEHPIQWLFYRPTTMVTISRTFSRKELVYLRLSAGCEGQFKGTALRDAK